MTERLLCEKACIPLCCKLAAGLGSEGGRMVSGLDEVVEVLLLQRQLFPSRKDVQQEEEG